MAGNNAINWSRSSVEPKRAYRFIVPFPIFIPKTGQAGKKISEIFQVDGDLRDGAKTQHGTNCYYEMAGVSCTLPSVETQLYRVRNPEGGFNAIRKEQPSKYDFGPIEIELIDTYEHDIQASLTAMLFATGRVTPTLPVVALSSGATSAKDVLTTAKPLQIRNIDTQGADLTAIAPREFHIIELMDQSRFKHANGAADRQNAPVHQPNIRARKIILYEPYITGISYGTLHYADIELPKVKIQLTYDYFDYEYTAFRSQGDAQGALSVSKYGARAAKWLRADPRRRHR